MYNTLFKNRKQNIICFDIYGCSINRMYNKNSLKRISRIFHTCYCRLATDFSSRLKKNANTNKVKNKLLRNQTNFRASSND